jgi:hypothetical protein
MSNIKAVLNAASESARGVEENSSSRFVDYTMATPWETLSSEIEQAIKKWNSLNNNNSNNNNYIQEIIYLGCKFNLLYYNKNNLNHDIYSWFGIKKFILLSKQSQWSGGTGTHSERHTLFSALVNGLTSSGVIDIPVFFCATTSKNINNATDVLGYHIKNLNSTLHPCLQFENELSYTSIIHYESHIINGIDINHDFFYLDGLKQLFFEKLGLFSLYNINTNNFNLHFRVTEYFQYVNDKSRMNPEFNLSSNTLKYFEDLNERFDPFLIDSRKYYGSVINYGKLCQIAHMTVKLQYPGLGQNSVIDNRQYTTLIPSKQSSTCWSINISFNNHLKPLLDNEDEESVLNNDESYSKKVSPFSHCLRRLLAFYILGKCCGKGSTPSNLIKKKSNHNNIYDLFDGNQAKSFTSLLSRESQEAVENVLDNNKLGYYDENESKNEEIYEEKQRFELFYSYLFDKGLNNEDFNKDEKLTNETIKENYQNKWLNEDSIFNLVEMGSWVSRFGIFMGNLNGGAILMLDFWFICLQEFRNRWEESLLLPHLESFYARDDTDNEPIRSLWLDVLWQDLIEKKRIDSGINIQLPDKKQLLLVQKLQMLQMCIAFKNEDTVCKSPKRKQDMTVFSPESLKQENEISINSSITNIDRVKKIVKSPQLQRRLPMTQDAEAQHLHISQKLSSGNSRSGVENPLLRWQVELPALVSDIKAFKAENISADFETFKEWYFDGILNWSDVPIDMANLNIVWDSCTPVHASQQKPMFRAETEGEKVLGMLENLSITELAAELLSASVISLYNFMSFELYAWCNKDNEDIVNNSISQDLSSLKESIKEVLHHISIDSTSNNMDEEESIISSQHFLVLMDGIIIQTAQLEEFIERARQLSLLIPFSEENEGLSTRLIISLCKNKEYKAENEEEGKYIFSLAKKISRGSDSHNWHSFDGRELGLPTTKIFDLTFTSKSNLTTESSSSLSNPSLEPQVEHSMNVNIEHGRLRASFSCVEIDFE